MSILKVSTNPLSYSGNNIQIIRSFAVIPTKRRFWRHISRRGRTKSRLKDRPDLLGIHSYRPEKAPRDAPREKLITWPQTSLFPLQRLIGGAAVVEAAAVTELPRAKGLKEVVKLKVIVKLLERIENLGSGVLLIRSCLFMNAIK